MICLFLVYISSYIYVFVDVGYFGTLNPELCFLLSLFLYISLSDNIIGHYFMSSYEQTLSNCRVEVCKALAMAENECELSMGMSGDFELAVNSSLRLDQINFLSFGIL